MFNVFFGGFLSVFEAFQGKSILFKPMFEGFLSFSQGLFLGVLSFVKAFSKGIPILFVKAFPQGFLSLCKAFC